jgi:heptosyltransferase-2
MKILIELPTWLGDTVMTTPSIENITKLHPDAKITVFGSFVSTQALKPHPNVVKTVIDNSKKEGFRYKNLYTLAKSLGRFDIALSFRRSFTSKFFLYFVDAKIKRGYKRYTKEEIHQTIRYNDFINIALNIESFPKDLKLYFTPKIYTKPTIGINPGATYGSAKRWYPDRFAKVAKEFANKFDILIFGGPNEVEMANDIERELQKSGMKNYKNLAGKTTVKELIEHIGGLSLFITADSGPMHVAAAFKIPTVSLFGPTKFKETSQWQNPNGKMVRFDLECSPCMKRECPLKTHECMKLITPTLVIKEAKALLENIPNTHSKP